MKSYKLGITFASVVVLVMALAVGALAAPNGATVHEVFPTGDPTQDVQNVQAAIDGAVDGDTILLKAGTFAFGDWKTNPIPGGVVAINKGVTVTGDGFDGSGNPRTIVQGGGYRMKGHWQHGERGVFGFGGDTTGGVLQDLWLKEPHFLAVNSNGSNVPPGDHHHRSFVIRNLKITDISHDIPAWNPYQSVGPSISLGWNLPEWGRGGPSGTVVIEGCDISHMGSTVDLDYIDSETRTPYYRDPEGGDLALHDSRAINTFICTTGSFVIRNNTIRAQSAGIVNEAMSGTGDISVLTGAVIRNNQIRGAAQYGMLSVSGAQYRNIYGNNLATFEPSVAHIGLYGLKVHDNTLSGYSGVVIVADGAYNNQITGYTPMSP